MPGENFTTTQSYLFATDADVRTRPGTVVSGQNLAALTPVKLTAAYKFTALTAADDVAVGIMVTAVDASGGDAAGVVYTSGDFILDALVGWPGTITTNLNKQAVFAGSPIQLIPYVTGDTAPATY